MADRSSKRNKEKLLKKTVMSFNSSNASLPPHLSSSNASLYPASASCYDYTSTFLILATFAVTNIVILLPFCILILYLGLQRRQKQSLASDIFTYHMVAVEMIGIAGCGFFCCGAGAGVPWLMATGTFLMAVTSNGQIFFHILTCMERHLAVVHPITYLALRNRDGVKVRNVAIGCVWLLFFGSFGLTGPAVNYSTVPGVCLSVLSIAIVLFCSLFVLRALIRPGPGEGGEGRERVNHSKMRAFCTIMAIMGTLLLRCGGHLLVLVVYSSPAVSMRFRCVVLVFGVWFSLPSSLVLPLLFLQRAGKLRCYKNNNDSGEGSD